MTQIVSKRQKQILFEKTHKRCAYCGKKLTLESMTVDHIVPQNDFRTKGVKVNNGYENLLASCEECNLTKGCMSLKNYRSLIVTLRKNYSIWPVNTKDFKFYYEKEKPVLLKDLEEKYGKYKSHKLDVKYLKALKAAEKSKKSSEYNMSTFIKTFIDGFDLSKSC